MAGCLGGTKLEKVEEKLIGETIEYHCASRALSRSPFHRSFDALARHRGAVDDSRARIS